MIQAVDRAIRVLLALQGARRLGVSELARRLDLPKATVHGLLKTLAARGLVEQDPASEKYMLGPAVLRLGNVYLDSHELRARSLRWADALAERTGQAVRVGVLLFDEVVVIQHVFRPSGGPQVREVGIAIPAHASALGKALLAYRPDDAERVLGSALARLTGRTTVDPDLLRKELGTVAESGIAEERDEAVLGESGLAGAVFDSSGRAVAAVAVVVPSNLLGEEDPDALRQAVREAARAISRELGAPTWPPLRPE